MDSLSRDQVRRIDRCAIEIVGTPGVVLMENAGRGAADAIEAFAGEAARGAVAVVAGTGNNGGDGFVIARRLAMRGAKVVTFLTGPEEKITLDAAVNLNVIRNLAHDVRPVSPAGAEGLGEQLAEFGMVVDAVGGTGIRGPLRGAVAEVVRQINAAGRPVVAVDIPTGLDCDTGEAPDPTVRAAMTVTFVARKRGFDASSAGEYTGQVRVVDIGIPPEIAWAISRRQA